MKINTVAVTALLIGATSFLNAGNVYSPDRGVICDRKAGFCVDSYGISLGMTEEYLGRRASNKVDKMLGMRSFDKTRFTLSNGLSCDTNRKVCKKSKWDDNADAHWTRVLFGRSVGHSSDAKSAESIRLSKGDCKNYISEKFDIPRSAVHTYGGKYRPGTTTISISIKSREPYIDERGTCSVIYGDVSYKANYER